MRFLIPAALVAALFVPTAAQACDKCIYHGTARENATWDKILAKPAAKPVQIAKAPVKPAPVKAPAAKAQPAKTRAAK